MYYCTVKETAQRWGVSVRTVNLYLNEGRVPGAVRKGYVWLVPADANKPGDRRSRGAEPGQPRCEKRFMPILSMPTDPGGFEVAVMQLDDGEEQMAARAGYHYFRGEGERAMELAQRGFDSESAEIRLTMRWLHAMSAIGQGDAASCREDFAQIKHEGESAVDDTVRALSEFIGLIARIYFHEQGVDGSCLIPYFDYLPQEVRYFAIYGRAHALYLRQEYHQAIGEVEASTALLGQNYPLNGIYLNIVGAMASISLARQDDARRFFDRAWELAAPFEYYEPFAQHHGMLQGLVESKLRRAQPELYQRISDMVIRFSRGWMRIHNAVSEHKVTDELTPYEFSIAMLAAKGRSNKEIAEYLSISVNSVKTYLAAVFQKTGITKRSDLKNHVNF